MIVCNIVMYTLNTIKEERGTVGNSLRLRYAMVRYHCDYSGNDRLG